MSCGKDACLIDGASIKTALVSATQGGGEGDLGVEDGGGNEGEGRRAAGIVDEGEDGVGGEE